MFDKLILYYFTGTGNALSAAMWISEVASKLNIETKVVKITPSLKVAKEDISEHTLIGFCYPTHGFNAPPVVIDFLLRLPKMKNRVFVLNTRAGMKMHKLFTPGLSGLAQILPAFILRFKGLKAVGFQPMDLPSNWISVHPGVKVKVVESIFLRCKQITKKFAENILLGKKVYRGLISLPIDLLLSPIAIVYYIFGRFTLAKTFIADSNCNSCGLCEKECPINAIKMKNARPFWAWKCENCMHCMNICPQRAIQTPHVYVIILFWLVFSILPLAAIRELVAVYPVFSEYFDLSFNLFVLITSLPIIFFSYRILHFLMRFKFIQWIITYTSLTKFKFWRRYLAPKKFIHLPPEK